MLAKRISSVLHAVLDSELDEQSRIAFLRENLLNVVDCSHVSLWTPAGDGFWNLFAEAGSGHCVDGDAQGWQQFNREVAQSQNGYMASLPGGTRLWSGAIHLRPGRRAVVHASVGHSNLELVALVTEICVRLMFAVPVARGSVRYGRTA